MTANRPRWAAEFATLAAVAADLAAQRALHYPGLVAKGTLTLADADAGIRIMKAIAADWQRSLDRKPIPADVECATRAERVTTLETAIARHRRRITKAHADMWKTFADADAVPFPEAGVAELRALVAMGMKPAEPVEHYCVQADYGECIETLLWWERQRFGITEITDWNIAARLRFPVTFPAQPKAA